MAPIDWLRLRVFGPIFSPLLTNRSAEVLQRAVRHTRVIGSFASVQVVVQVIGFATGILLVRMLEQREYAYFTIANTMQGTMNVLADIGISIGLVSIGGRVWHDPHRFGALIVTAQALRRKLGTLATVVVAPILVWMLLRNGASPVYALILVVLIIAGLLVQLSLGVLTVVPRLRSDVSQIQRIDLTGAIARLLVLLGCALLFLNAGVAILVGVAALFLQSTMLHRYAAGVIDLKAPENAEDRAAMTGFIKNQAANAIFFCLQGQITILLITFFAKRATAVAEVGALGRLAMIFTIIGQLLTNILVPAFARAQQVSKMRLQFAAIIGGVAGFSAAVIAGAVLCPDQILFILGGKYAHLQHELLLMIGGAVVSTLAGTFWVLNAAKAWVAGSWLYVPLTVATQVALIPFIDFSNVSQVLTFNLVAALPNLLLNMALSYRGFRSFRPAT